MQTNPLEQYSQKGVEAITSAGQPIPGQSMTASPDELRPFESPPEFTKFKEALDYVAAELLQEEVYTQIVLALGEGVPVTDVATQIGYVGFREGKWNPDLMLMLMEPIMYLLMALCEKAGVEYRVDSEDSDEEEESEESVLSQKAKNIAQVAKAKMQKSGGIPAGVLPQEIAQQIEAIEIQPESLLQQPEMQTEPLPEAAQPQQSLLDRG